MNQHDESSIDHEEHCGMPHMTLPEHNTLFDKRQRLLPKDISRLRSNLESKSVVALGRRSNVSGISQLIPKKIYKEDKRVSKIKINETIINKRHSARTDHLNCDICIS